MPMPKTEFMPVRTPLGGEICDLLTHLDRHSHRSCRRSGHGNGSLNSTSRPSPAKRSMVPSNLSINVPSVL
jgi:hypothetical protein